MWYRCSGGQLNLGRKICLRQLKIDYLNSSPRLLFLAHFRISRINSRGLIMKINRSWIFLFTQFLLDWKWNKHQISTLHSLIECFCGFVHMFRYNMIFFYLNLPASPATTMAGRMKTTFGNPCWKGSSFPLSSTIILRSDCFVQPHQIQQQNESKTKKLTTMQRKKTGTKCSTDSSATVNTQRHLTIAILLRVSKGIKREWVSARAWTSEMEMEFSVWIRNERIYTYNFVGTSADLCDEFRWCVSLSPISALLFRLLHAVFVSSTNLPRMMTYKSAQIHTRSHAHTHTQRQRGTDNNTYSIGYRDRMGFCVPLLLSSSSSSLCFLLSFVFLNYY